MGFGVCLGAGVGFVLGRLLGVARGKQTKKQNAAQHQREQREPRTFFRRFHVAPLKKKLSTLL
jgi:hypothetical protein